MGQDIKYTEAELRSFAEVPETCDAIDKELAKIGECMLNIDDTLKSYRIEPTDQLRYAIHEMFHKAINLQVFAAKDAIHAQTFALRLALITRIEAEIIAEGRPVAPNHYRHWIKHITRRASS